MASSGGGSRQGGGSRTGNRSGNGNRAGSGNRKPSTSRGTATEQPRQSSAAERARERVEQGATRPVRTGQRGRPQPARAAGGRRPPQRGGRSTAMTAGIFGGTFVLLAAVIIIIFSVSNGSGGGRGHNKWVAPFPATATVTSSLLHVPNSELAAAGTGGTAVYGVGPKGSGASIVALSGRPLTKDGKPLFVYFGSEYCPYCAASRWPVAIALSKFGTLTGLQQTTSSYLDAYPGTHTLTFAKAKYTSPYLAFNETEQLTNHCHSSAVITNPQGGTPAYVCNNLDYYPLQSPSKQVISLINQYDNATYFGSADAQGAGIPFMDIGGKYVESGALYDPTLLQGASWSQIVAAFHQPTAGIGQAILGAANRYIAMICQATGNKPSICSQPFVKSEEKTL